MTSYAKHLNCKNLWIYNFCQQSERKRLSLTISFTHTPSLFEFGLRMMETQTRTVNNNNSPRRKEYTSSRSNSTRLNQALKEVVVSNSLIIKLYFTDAFKI